MKPRKYLKLFLINVLVFAALLAAVEFVAMISLEIMYLNQRDERDKRADLSVYENEPWAATYFEEKQQNVAAFKSYYGWKTLPFKGETISIDSHGRRKTTEISDIYDEQFRVAFLGGSTMQGVGSRDHETIPSQFVTQGEGRFSATNYGEGAFSAYQSYSYFQIEVLKGAEKPDLVITYDGVNDSGIGREQFAHMRESQMQRTMKGADRGQSVFMGRTRQLIDKLKKVKVKDKKFAFGPNTIKRQKEAAVELLESWLQMKYLCDRIGAKFLCILQFHRENRRPYFDYYDVLKSLLEEPQYAQLKAHFIDMTSAFDHIPLVYIDHSHVGPKGNEVIARLLLESLEDRDWFMEE